MPAARISFEFFPPQSLDASFRLWETVRDLAPLQPNFVSVTYGAGGTTRDLTHDAVAVIHKQYRLNVAAHLTCVNASKAETMAIVERYAEAGVREIVALRGDPPKGEGKFTPHPEGFAHSAELIEAIKATGKFKIYVGAYPDIHPDAPDAEADIRWLKRKVEAGADAAITQFFFEPEDFFRFRDRAEKAGITVPIIPGILPIENWAGTKRFAARCGTVVPAHVDEAFTKASETGDTGFGAEFCIDQCRQLMEGGVDHLHFYTLNKPHLSRGVIEALGLAPEVTPAAV